jgi:DNA-binding transcriptional LysR family regulator
VRRMQVLRAVVTSGSITAAATNLGYTPSAISQQITVLEREADQPQKVTPTEPQVRRHQGKR